MARCHVLLLALISLVASTTAQQRVCQRTSPLVGQSAPFLSLAAGLQGTITVLDDCHFRVDGFGMTGGPAVFFYALDHGRRISDAHLQGQFDGESFHIELAHGYTFNHFEELGVYCEVFQKVFGYLDLGSLASSAPPPQPAVAGSAPLPYNPLAAYAEYL